MSSNLHRNSTEANKHTPKGFDLADNNSTLLRDERGQSRYIDNLVNERVENIVDGFNAPPTTTSGHLYVLIDNGSGSVHADWNGANYDDIVRIQDGVWASITPVNGYLVFNKTDEKYYKFGSLGWEEFGVGASIELYDDADVTPLTARLKQRAVDYIEFVDDAINEEIKVQLRASELADFNSTDIIEVGGVFKLALDTNKLYVGNIEGLATQKTLSEVFDTATEDMSTAIFHVVDGKVELLVPTGEIIVGDALQRGRSATVTSALDTLSNEVGDIFIVGLDGKVQLGGTPTYIIRFNANGEGEAQKLIQGNNKALVTNGSGVEEEVDLISFLDLLTATGVTSNGVLNTTDLSGTARGILGSWKITDLVIENTTANNVTINLGTTPGGNDVLNNTLVSGFDFKEFTPLIRLFFKNTEQPIYASSSDWNSASLIIKFSVKKVY